MFTGKMELHLQHVSDYIKACTMLSMYEIAFDRGLTYTPFNNLYTIAPACTRHTEVQNSFSIVARLEEKLKDGHVYDHYPYDTELDELLAVIVHYAWPKTIPTLQSIFLNGRPYWLELNMNYTRLSIYDIPLKTITCCNWFEDPVISKFHKQSMPYNLNLEYEIPDTSYELFYCPSGPNSRWIDNIRIKPRHVGVQCMADDDRELITIVKYNKLWDEDGKFIPPEGFPGIENNI